MSTIDKSNEECDGMCGSGEVPRKNLITSCDQKMKDGACENNTTSSIDTVSESINNMNISNNVNATVEAGGDSNISPGMSMFDCKKVKGASKYNEVNDIMLHNSDNVSVCANCGKEGSDVNNRCNKCKMVKYCNAACKKKHRHKHKKECEEHLKQVADKRSEELRLAAEKHDEELFKQPPPKEDCPICFLLMPTLHTGERYKSCCGKVICSGCIYAIRTRVGKTICPFCRTPLHTSDKEGHDRHVKRMELGDPSAMFGLGCDYWDGEHGCPRDHTKAFELFHQAGDLGHAEAMCNIGYAYDHDDGVKVDKEKASYYYKLSAMAGDVHARYNLGKDEERAGNIDRALKHYMIAVRSGDNASLQEFRRFYFKGKVSKEDYTKALQSYQVYLGEIKSVQRDKAATFDYEEYRYY